MIATLLDLGRRALGAVKRVVRHTRRARHAGRRYTLRAAVASARRAFDVFDRELERRAATLAGLEHPAFERLRIETAALARETETNDIGTTSILIVVDDVHPTALARCLASSRRQGTPALETLVATTSRTPDEAASVLRQARKDDPTLDVLPEPVADQPSALAALVERARGDGLLLLDGTSWLRPDLLFRHHQLLHLLPVDDRARIVVTSAAYPIDRQGTVVGEPDLGTSARAHPPLLFAVDDLRAGVRVPAPSAKGWQPTTGGDAVLDLGLYALAHGARLETIPLPLCARQPTTPSDRHGATVARSLEQLEGPLVVRAGRLVPRPGIDRPSLQVIIPFRDQASLTLACVDAVLAQAWPGVEITAIDHGGGDVSLVERLDARGVEVLRDDGAWNYSRLNNRAAARRDTELILFLNNDVTLADGALATLADWTRVPTVGLVGCALFYPDGRLQHGGLERDSNGPSAEIAWHLIERGLPRDRLHEARRTRVVDGVTCACAMIRRTAFDDVGGFDARHYPNAFSDTDLALRLQARGLRHVYVAEAEGIHVESASRPGDRQEDVEGSTWLHQRLTAARAEPETR